MMTYDDLYNSMVKKFTVEKDNTDYTLGDYMLMRAKAKKNALIAKEEAANLPVAHEEKKSSLSTVLSYVNDKLTVKVAPVRNKTMRSFPLRTSFSAFCSALVMCALVISCSLFAVTAINDQNASIVAISEEPAIEENAITEIVL